MSRNSSGVYTAPSNSFNPAVADTTIDPDDWNATLADMETALSTDAGWGVAAGAETAPGLYINNDTQTGLYSPAAGEVALTADGTDVLHSDGGDLVAPVLLRAEGGLEVNGGHISELWLSGGDAADTSGLEIELTGTFKRYKIRISGVIGATADTLLEVQAKISGSYVTSYTALTETVMVGSGLTVESLTAIYAARTAIDQSGLSVRQNDFEIEIVTPTTSGSSMIRTNGATRTGVTRTAAYTGSSSARITDIKVFGPSSNVSLRWDLYGIVQA